MLAHNADNTTVAPDYTNEAYLHRLRLVHMALADSVRALGDAGKALVAIQASTALIARNASVPPSPPDLTPRVLSSFVIHSPVWAARATTRRST